MMQVKFRIACCIGLVSLSGLLVQLLPRESYRLLRIATDRFGGGDASISPDGKVMVISSRRTGNWELWLYNIQAARWTQLTHNPADDFEAEFSPDGKRLAFTSTRTGHKDIWLLSINSGQETRLTFSEYDSEYPAWSPDGTRIVYTSGPWGARDFFIVPAAGGSARRITRESGRAGACSFEPGGDSLICHRYDPGSGNLFRIWIDSGELNPLTAGKAWDYKPNESPDGQWIAFSRSDEGPAGIWLIPHGGGRSQRLTGTAADDRWPFWAGNGRLFFHRVVNRGTFIKMLDRRSGEVRVLVGPKEAPLQASLDSRSERLVYCSQTSQGRVLKILDLVTGNSRTLDTGAGEATFPRWSPDGKNIAFVRRSDTRWNLAITDVESSYLLPLTDSIPGLHGMDGPIDWSPDGSTLLFHADTQPFEANIYTVDVRSRNVTAVTKGAWFDESPSWRPDGSGILFMSTRGGNFTWSLMQLTLGDRSMRALAGPDWVEKNFPRMSSQGFAVWSQYEENGNEFLTERSPRGDIRVWRAAGASAQWPSYSGDGRAIVFTEMDHNVEYWLATNLFSAGSPLLTQEPARTSTTGNRESLKDSRSTSASIGGRSPTVMYRR